MKLKKHILALSIVVFMFISGLFLTTPTFAYWSIRQLSVNETVDVNIGEWIFSIEWDPDATYNTGDIVSRNGVLYQAKRNNPTREPGEQAGWQSDWDAL